MTPWHDAGLVAALVRRDIRYEWVLSLCMVFSFAAVFAPLFILLGIKNGVTGGMLAKIQRDPLSCLVTPKFPFDQNFDESFVRELRQKAAVVIYSPDSHILLDIGEPPNGVNVMPTVATDPLMVENGIALDDGKPQAVLSAVLAARLKKSKGDSLSLPLWRRLGGQAERATIDVW